MPRSKSEFEKNVFRIINDKRSQACRYGDGSIDTASAYSEIGHYIADAKTGQLSQLFSKFSRDDEDVASLIPLIVKDRPESKSAAVKALESNGYHNMASEL